MSYGNKDKKYNLSCLNCKPDYIDEINPEEFGMTEIVYKKDVNTLLDWLYTNRDLEDVDIAKCKEKQLCPSPLTTIGEKTDNLINKLCHENKKQGYQNAINAVKNFLEYNRKIYIQKDGKYGEKCNCCYKEKKCHND